MSDENTEHISITLIKYALSIFFTALALVFIYKCLYKPFLLNDCSSLYALMSKMESIFRVNMPYVLKNLCSI
jgi:hypothetical protein